MQAVAALDNLAVETVHSRAHSFNLELGVVTKCGKTVEALAMGDEGGVVVEHDFGSAGVGTAVSVRSVEKSNLRGHRVGDGCGGGVEFSGEEPCRSRRSSVTTVTKLAGPRVSGGGRKGSVEQSKLIKVF